jgi:chemotaxis family two-component system sensor kinase Cph1
VEEPIRRLRAQLEQCAREASDALADLEDFTYVVSDDLKEPLFGIETYATVLLEDYRARLDDEGRRLIAALLDLAVHQRRMIDALHCYARAGRAALALEETDLNSLLTNVIGALRASVLNTDVEVRIPRPLPPARCDPSLVRDVWRSLIANAATFNDKPEKWVELGGAASSDGAPAVFYVRDNGIGIPEKHRASIFSMFSRLAAGASAGPGVGSGLALARKIVHRHGGTIWVESTVGEGSTFHFTLASQAPQ